MKSALARATWVGLSVLAALIVIAAWNPRGNYWHSVEPPKAQCEAYGVHQLSTATQLSRFSG